MRPILKDSYIFVSLKVNNLCFSAVNIVCFSVYKKRKYVHVAEPHFT